ncbi:hypothetical protein ACFP81_13925 [Deinococcus lacus]|uniref:Imidazole glycerol phosphate synthase subunit HisH n=1 Tax=Deinococcus lacus TaxID=392561 RepID=A0ABW1YHF2_9DEIO
MRELERLALPEVLRAASQPVLGICLGMQLLTLGSEEGGKPPRLALVLPRYSPAWVFWRCQRSGLPLRVCLRRIWAGTAFRLLGLSPCLRA